MRSRGCGNLRPRAGWAPAILERPLGPRTSRPLFAASTTAFLDADPASGDACPCPAASRRSRSPRTCCCAPTPSACSRWRRTATARVLQWVEPERRGVFPLDQLIISKSLAKTVRADRYQVTADRAFREVMQACAAREKTWINAEILKLYGDLHAQGYAHSIEAWARRRTRRRPLWRQPRRRLLRREHVFTRARRLKGRARASGRAPKTRRLPAARHAVPHRLISQPSARSRSAAPNTAAGSPPRSPASATSRLSRRTPPMPGAQALDLARGAA